MPRYTTSRRSSSGSTHQQHHHNHHQGSSSSSSSSTSSSPRSTSQRPRLLRSSATTPAITASSSEIQGSVISPNSPHTAAEMLNRMAPSYYMSSHHQHHHHQQRYHQAVDIERQRSVSAESFASTPGNSLDDGYFSFPEFDVWEREEEGHDLKQEGE
jgi:hypothetical protein